MIARISSSEILTFSSYSRTERRPVKMLTKSLFWIRSSIHALLLIQPIYFDSNDVPGYPNVILNYELRFIANINLMLIQKGKMMKANEVSKLTDLPISTLRFYERKQLIPKQFISRVGDRYR
ncbi:MerR family DNA-binding transcriptional regulator [Cohnella ginsengisoli]